jgi:hypothetical protein
MNLWFRVGYFVKVNWNERRARSFSITKRGQCFLELLQCTFSRDVEFDSRGNAGDGRR